ncbi:MAG: hypothetical protein ACPGWM_02705 [Flavobacteriales bacterium]
MDSETFVFDARMAAITILKNRNCDSQAISLMEEEEKQKKSLFKLSQSKSEYNQAKLIRNIERIGVGEKKAILLKNGNELRIKRISSFKFRIQIEDFWNYGCTPIMICRIKDKSNYKAYPFYDLNKILGIGMIGGVVLLVLGLMEIVDLDKWLILWPVSMVIAIQTLMMPLMYFIILRTFKEQFGQD